MIQGNLSETIFYPRLDKLNTLTVTVIGIQVMLCHSGPIVVVLTHVVRFKSCNYLSRKKVWFDDNFLPVGRIRSPWRLLYWYKHRI